MKENTRNSRTLSSSNVVAASNAANNASNFPLKLSTIAGGQGIGSFGVKEIEDVMVYEMREIPKGDEWGTRDLSGLVAEKIVKIQNTRLRWRVRENFERCSTLLIWCSEWYEKTMRDELSLRRNRNVLGTRFSVRMKSEFCGLRWRGERGERGEKTYIERETSEIIMSSDVLISGNNNVIIFKSRAQWGQWTAALAISFQARMKEWGGCLEQIWAIRTAFKRRELTPKRFSDVVSTGHGESWGNKSGERARLVPPEAKVLIVCNEGIPCTGLMRKLYTWREENDGHRKVHAHAVAVTSPWMTSPNQL